MSALPTPDDDLAARRERGPVVEHRTGEDGQPVPVREFDHASDAVGATVRNPVLRGTDPDTATYEADVDGQHVNFGTAAQLLNLNRVRAVIFAATNRALPPRDVKAADWDRIAELIAKYAQRVDGADAETEQTSRWVGSYIQSKSNAEQLNAWDDLDANARSYIVTAGDPCRVGRNVAVRAEEVAQHVRNDLGDRVTPHQLSMRLSRAGWTPRQLAARANSGNVAKARYWLSPAAGWEPSA